MAEMQSCGDSCAEERVTCECEKVMVLALVEICRDPSAGEGGSDDEMLWELS